MSKHYPLKGENLLPKKDTIRRILQFSRSIQVISLKNQKFLINKN